MKSILAMNHTTWTHQDFGQYILCFVLSSFVFREAGGGGFIIMNWNTKVHCMEGVPAYGCFWKFWRNRTLASTPFPKGLPLHGESWICNYTLRHNNFCRHHHHHLCKNISCDLTLEPISGGSRISQRGVRQLQRWGRQPIIFANFPQKLNEIEEIWTEGGGARPWRPPLDPPMPIMNKTRFNMST